MNKPTTIADLEKSIAEKRAKNGEVFTKTIAAICDGFTNGAISELNIFEAGYSFKYTSPYTKETHVVWVDDDTLMVSGNDPIIVRGDTSEISEIVFNSEERKQIHRSVGIYQTEYTPTSVDDSMEILGEIFLGAYDTVADSEPSDDPELNYELAEDEEEYRDIWGNVVDTTEHNRVFAAACALIGKTLSQSDSNLTYQNKDTIGCEFLMGYHSHDIYVEVTKTSIKLITFEPESGFHKTALLYGDASKLYELLFAKHIIDEIARKSKSNQYHIDLFKKILDL